MEAENKKAIKILKSGGIVIFPTDTVFGIGCRIDDERAVDRLFKIKKKPLERVAPVLVSDLRMAQKYLKPIPKDVIEKLIKPYWPGGLTIILPCLADKVPIRLQGENSTLGVRVPEHNTLLDVIKNIGVPIVGTSANFYGKKAPGKFSDIDKKLISLVDFALPGKCKKKIPSTIIDCSKKPWKILRGGAIVLEDLRVMNILFIDTASSKEIKIELKIDEKKYLMRRKIGLQKAQVVLPMIEKLLYKHSMSFKDIDAINVNTGPGSFTGLRVGISIANTLGAFLEIPVNDKKIGDLVEPAYK